VQLDGMGESGHNGDGWRSWKRVSLKVKYLSREWLNSPLTLIDRMQSKASSAVDTSS
jgi:hypothetical protein